MPSALNILNIALIAVLVIAALSVRAQGSDVPEQPVVALVP